MQKEIALGILACGCEIRKSRREVVRNTKLFCCDYDFGKGDGEFFI